MLKKYSAFTLVELLIVMGILIILLTVGVMVGRFAILKSQDTQHKDAARNLYALLLQYKNDSGIFPGFSATGGSASCYGCIGSNKEMLAYITGQNGLPQDHLLKPYMDAAGGFDGGNKATYYYYVDEYERQFVLICVSLGGIDDEMERGFYCTGNGIGALPEHNPIPRNDIGSIESGDPYAIVIKGNMDESDWDPKEGGFWLSN